MIYVMSEGIRFFPIRVFVFLVFLVVLAMIVQQSWQIAVIGGIHLVGMYVVRNIMRRQENHEAATQSQ